MHYSVKKEPWSEAEDRIILVCQSEHGNKWAEISKKLPGRYTFGLYFTVTQL
jgi:Myb-like DNA-binding domain